MIMSLCEKHSGSFSKPSHTKTFRQHTTHSVLDICTASRHKTTYDMLERVT